MVTAQEASAQLQEYLDSIKDQFPEGWIGAAVLRSCPNPGCGRPILLVEFGHMASGTSAHLLVGHSDPEFGMFAGFEAGLANFKAGVMPHVIETLKPLFVVKARFVNIGSGLVFIKNDPE